MADAITNGRISRSSLHSALTAPTLPRWDVVDTLVEILATRARNTSPEQELDGFLELWKRAATDLDLRSTSGPSPAALSRVVEAPARRVVIFVSLHQPETGDDAVLAWQRRGLFESVKSALAKVSIDPGATELVDRGDGLFFVLDPTVPPHRVLGLWVAELHEAVRGANQLAKYRQRLRVGIHQGVTVRDDRHGPTGYAVTVAARLCDATFGRNLLSAGGDLVVGISEDLWKGVVLQGHPHVRPEDYTQTEIEHSGSAWFRVLGQR
ncbi:hypothetical protein [Streptacidiphilus sp. MAP12-16]|uniref:hypothetical protein n=1 Tax=Streptacidiphilus sp. MAP12-16 TaxID=3156300 RepID=UPI0035115EAF